ncbi:MAG: hypothetical protein JWR18_4281, partial [Segetibacter sp.]|nr:hypothetical protein [Segetibacter sp.]
DLPGSPTQGYSAFFNADEKSVEQNQGGQR